jgi:hypothetical protein
MRHKDLAHSENTGGWESGCALHVIHWHHRSKGRLGSRDTARKAFTEGVLPAGIPPLKELIAFARATLGGLKLAGTARLAPSLCESKASGHGRATRRFTAAE